MTLDYSPEKGTTSGVDLAHGPISREHKDQINSVRGAIARRLNLGGADSPNVFHEVILPPDAPDCLAELLPIIASYEAAMIPGQHDLLTITSVRFDPSVPLHRQRELGRRFAVQSFAEKRQLACIIAQHVPSRLGFKNKPHIHIIAFARLLHGSNWGAFTELRYPGGKAALVREWATLLTDA